MGSPWGYFEALEEGGRLYQPELLRPLTKFDEALQGLNQIKDQNEQDKICSECGAIGDFVCFQGCFCSFYCSETCQEHHWISAHNLDCRLLASCGLKRGAKLPPAKPSSLLGKYRRSLRSIQDLSREVENLKRTLAESDNEKDTMEEERGVYKLVIEDLKI